MKFRPNGLKAWESRAIKRIRVRMWKKCPGCRNCFKRTVLPSDAKSFDQHNVATIQHLDPSYSIWRLYYGNVDESRMELWCFECNQDDGKQTWVKEMAHLYRYDEFKLQNFLIYD